MPRAGSFQRELGTKIELSPYASAFIGVLVVLEPRDFQSGDLCW